jgi:phage tail-like protein
LTYVLTSRQSPDGVASHVGRGHVDGLPTPKSIVDLMPAALQDDDFCVRFVTGLDDVMAPLFATLDCVDTYLDPMLAPPDFVEWLASWVGIEVDETWDLDARRSLVRNAVVLYRIRGTAPGLAAHLRLYTGATPTIEETGGCIWSQTADTPFPGQATPTLKVRVTVDDDEGLRLSTISRIVASSGPAHIPYLVELVVGGGAVQSLDEEGESEEGAADAPGAVSLPGSETIELAPQAPATQEDMEAPADETPPPPEPEGA